MTETLRALQRRPHSTRDGTKRWTFNGTVEGELYLVFEYESEPRFAVEAWLGDVFLARCPASNRLDAARLVDSLAEGS